MTILELFPEVSSWLRILLNLCRWETSYWSLSRWLDYCQGVSDIGLLCTRACTYVVHVHRDRRHISHLHQFHGLAHDTQFPEQLYSMGEGKVPETMYTSKCQKLIFEEKVSDAESVRYWKCQILKVSDTESVRCWKCQIVKVSDSESVRHKNYSNFWKFESVKNWTYKKLNVLVFRSFS